MFTNDRKKMRLVFTEAWRKHQAKLPMEPMEQIIASIVQQHPEYHKLIQNPDSALDKDFLPEGGQTNPFLHLSMHIALQEQISTNRPTGITGLYRQITKNTGDPHETEHQLMDCLAQMLWEAQREKRIPDEQAYLKSIRALIPNKKG
ncbi:hypothetical protein MNBD_GAMMA26-1190 [hydrothermal vent metagenome]|uniref:DUF1841 domain-containing protein n=1 Tax=hydrothermal vent metagenome TaxID=652676 RepID=A0A3B1AUN8_9ZZZZ